MKTIRSDVPEKRTRAGHLEVIFWCVAVLLAILRVWASRNYMNEDTVSYLDIVMPICEVTGRRPSMLLEPTVFPVLGLGLASVETFPLLGISHSPFGKFRRVLSSFGIFCAFLERGA